MTRKHVVNFFLTLRSNTVVGDRFHGSGMVVSRIVKGNIPVQNGVVHLIDKPLMVVARSLYDYVMQEGATRSNRLYEFAQLVRDKGGLFGEMLLESKVRCWLILSAKSKTLDVALSGGHPFSSNKRSIPEARSKETRLHLGPPEVEKRVVWIAFCQREDRFNRQATSCSWRASKQATSHWTKSFYLGICF